MSVCSGEDAVPHIVVGQEKLFHLGTVESFGREYLSLADGIGEAGWFGSRVGIKRCLHIFVAGPEAVADHFMRIGFSGDDVSALAFGRAPTGKSRDRHIEAAPEEMHRTTLADES